MFQATIRFGLGSDTVWSARSRHELAPQGTLPFDGSCFKRTGKIDERFLTRHEGVRVRPTAAMIGVYKAPGAAPLKWVDATVPTAADWANGLHFPDLWFEVKKETPVPPLDPAVEERRRVSASVYNIATGKRCERTGEMANADMWSLPDRSGGRVCCDPTPFCPGLPLQGMAELPGRGVGRVHAAGSPHLGPEASLQGAPVGADTIDPHLRPHPPAGTVP